MGNRFSISAYTDLFGNNNPSWSTATFGDVDLEKTIRTFLGLNKEVTEEQFNRFKQLCAKEATFEIIPTGVKILDNIFSPLSIAKKNYLLGDYITTIALCGMVGEMITIFIFKINSFSHNGNTSNDENKFKKFEGMRQNDRVNELRYKNFISEEEKRQLNFLRTTRSQYLHSWERKENKIDSDAYQMYIAIVQVVKSTFDIRIVPPSLIINPKILNFLERLGEAKIREH